MFDSVQSTSLLVESLMQSLIQFISPQAVVGILVHLVLLVILPLKLVRRQSPRSLVVSYSAHGKAWLIDSLMAKDLK